MNKGTVIVIRHSDGTTQYATVLEVSGSTVTVQAADRCLYDAVNAGAPTATTQPAGPCLCDSDRYNCGNFSTQRQAQACMDWCVSQGRGDIHNLDGNADGEACESLPPGFQVVR